MIKLKDLLELKTMVYTDTVKPKHQKKMDKVTELFHNDLILPMISPPENDSKQTRKKEEGNLVNLMFSANTSRDLESSVNKGLLSTDQKLSKN